MTLITIIILISLWCNGLFVICGEGMIGELLDKWLEKTLPDKLYAPTLGCIKCMASVHGIAWCFVLLPLGYDMFWQIPLICVGSACLNTILYNLY